MKKCYFSLNKATIWCLSWWKILKCYLICTCVAFHVISGLVEVSHPWDVVLSGLSHDLSSVGDNHGRVPNNISVIPFQNGGNNHHVVHLGILMKKKKWIRNSTFKFKVSMKHFSVLWAPSFDSLFIWLSYFIRISSKSVVYLIIYLLSLSFPVPFILPFRNWSTYIFFCFLEYLKFVYFLARTLRKTSQQRSAGKASRAVATGGGGGWG